MLARATVPVLVFLAAMAAACGHSPTMPEPVVMTTPTPAPAPLADGEYAYGTDPVQRLDFRAPAGDGRAPLVLLVHGGGWTAGDKRVSAMNDYAEALRAAGFATANLNYRLTAYPAPVDDLASALDWLRLNAGPRVDSARCAIMGESAGGHIAAISVFVSGRCSAFVGLAGIYDLTTMKFNGGLDAWMGCSLAACQERWIEASPALFARHTPPALLMWGTADPIIPRAQVDAMSHASGGRLYILDGARHNGPEWQQPNVLKDVAAFLRSAI